MMLEMASIKVNRSVVMTTRLCSTMSEVKIAFEMPVPWE